MSYGFIITRHVNSDLTNLYWNKCIKCINVAIKCINLHTRV